jgi:hypothetical protein
VTDSVTHQSRDVERQQRDEVEHLSGGPDLQVGITLLPGDAFFTGTPDGVAIGGMMMIMMSLLTCDPIGSW